MSSNEQKRLSEILTDEIAKCTYILFQTAYGFVSYIENGKIPSEGAFWSTVNKEDPSLKIFLQTLKSDVEKNQKDHER